MREYFLLTIMTSLIILSQSEIHPDNMPSTLKCTYDKITISEDIFKLWSGYGCYNYTPGSHLKEHYYWNFLNNTIFVPNPNTIDNFPLVQQDGLEVYYDYTNPNMSQLIENTFVNSFFYSKWRDCAEQADMCCKNILSKADDIDGNLNCKPVWDGWSCFPGTKRNEIAYKQCPEFIYTGTGPTCIHYSTKYCSSTGEWNLSSYDSCIELNENKVIIEYYIALLLISIFVSIPASIIFASYYKLQTTRVKLHNNLIIMITLRNIFLVWISWYITFDSFQTIDLEETVVSKNSFLCRFIVFCGQLATNCMFGAMLADAFYMYQILVKTFDTYPPMKKYYFFIEGLCIITTIIWGLLQYFMSNNQCWINRNVYGDWIIIGLRGGTFLFNTVLLIGVVKVIIEKLRRHMVNVNHIRAASKATLILTPLFGVNYFLTSYHLEHNSCVIQDAYYYIGYTVDGLLGFIVSLLYCFLNREVQHLLASTIREIRTSYRISICGFSNQTRRSTDTLNTDRTQQHNSGTLMTPADSYHSLPLKTVHINTNVCVNNCNNYCEHTQLSQNHYG